MPSPWPTDRRPAAAGPYDATFYRNHAAGALSSGRIIAPIIVDLIQPGSVVDVGCGTGGWLRAFTECGVETVLGIDSDHLDRGLLEIPAERFRSMDLRRLEALGRKFDLAVCLEVAEHLPSAAAAGLVRYLTDAAPVVLFSAAPPGQGGTHHVNEQWPSYWAELFARAGYLRLDAIRPRVWREPDVQWWYKQNIALYASQGAVVGSPRLGRELALTRENPFELILERVLAMNVSSPRALLRALPAAVWRAVTRRAGG